MADAAFELGGVRIGCTSNGDGTYRINTATTGTPRYFEIGGTRVAVVDQGDGTCSLLVSWG